MQLICIFKYNLLNIRVATYNFFVIVAYAYLQGGINEIIF